MDACDITIVEHVENVSHNLFYIRKSYCNENAMEVHIIVDILLRYLGNLREWSVARVLCRHTHDIVAKKQYRMDVLGVRSFIRTNRCMCCLKHVDEPRWISHKAVPVSYMRYTVTCHHYMCQTSALFSMIRDLSTSNIHVLTSPFQVTGDIQIPRSNGTVTSGQCVTHGLAMIRNQYYVMTRWHDHCKNVPWSHYFDHEPRIVFKELHSVVDASI